MEPESTASARRDVKQGALIGIVVGALVLLAVGLAVGFTRGDGTADAWAGRVLTEVRRKPPIVLTDTDGNRFDLQRETEGKLTILFFGYTNCPDICPASLMNLDKALESMQADVRAKTQVVFVSVDPKRDKPDVIRQYLDSFDPSFIGLTGTPAELREAQDLAEIPRSTYDEPDATGFYTVGHSTEMLAYSSADDVAHLTYSYETRQSDWARDLPRLTAGESPTIDDAARNAAAASDADGAAG